MSSTITGSDKQATWAGAIRAEYIREIEKWGRAHAAAATKAGQGAQWQAVIDGMIALARAETRAAWWIDHRADTAFQGAVFTAHYTAAVAQVQAAT